VPEKPVEKVAAGIIDIGPIKADYRPKDGAPCAVLLHGVGAGKGEWAAFQDTLKQEGWCSLAFDARGHGDSKGKRWDRFTGPNDWIAILSDVEAMVGFLEAQGTPRSEIVLMGSSIGANLMGYAYNRDAALKLAILLSPGAQYQGVPLDQGLMGLDRRLILISAPDDAYSHASTKAAGLLLMHPESKILEAATGHGTDMLYGEKNTASSEAVLTILRGF